MPTYNDHYLKEKNFSNLLLELADFSVYYFKHSLFYLDNIRAPIICKTLDCILTFIGVNDWALSTIIKVTYSITNHKKHKFLPD